MCYDESAVLRWEDGTHGVIKRETEDVGEEVDGVARLVLPGPSPVMVFDEKTWMVCRLEVAGVECDEREAALLEQRDEWRETCGADLFAGPAWGLRNRSHWIHGV